MQIDSTDQKPKQTFMSRDRRAQRFNFTKTGGVLISGNPQVSIVLGVSCHGFICSTSHWPQATLPEILLTDSLHVCRLNNHILTMTAMFDSNKMFNHDVAFT